MEQNEKNLGDVPITEPAISAVSPAAQEDAAPIAIAPLTIQRVTDVGVDATLLGGDSTNPSWDEYLDGFQDEFKPHMKALRAYVEENGLVGMTAEAMQDRGEGEYRFSDGQEIAFTWRAWGDFMQAVVNKREGYMCYYM